ncbi:hypothetical protein RCL1_003358 [Eukaryota sp. TZLM3-RCL]
MGIKNLLQFMKPAITRTAIHHFSGQKVGIDGNALLYRASYCCATKLALNEPTLDYLKFCSKYLHSLLTANIIPIVVVDGSKLPTKDFTINERLSVKEQNLALGLEFFASQNYTEAHKKFKSCVSITSQMMSSFLALCAVLNVQVVQAPFEADSQLAYMSRIGVISTILTEDSDLILYGCSSILFKYDVINGTVDHFCSNSLHKTIFGKSNISILLEICLLSGCDYLRHLPGIGIVTARKMRLKFNSISETLLHLLSQKKIDMFYIRDFIKAFMSFVYQPIVDLRSGSINLLKNYNSDDVADYFQLKSNPIMASISVDLLINCPAFLMENYTPIDLPNLSREAIQSIISLDRRMAKKFKQSKMDLLCPPEKRVRKEILDPELLYKINSELEALQDDEDEELELDIDEMDLDENELFDLLHFNESIELGNDNKNKNIRITRYCTINTLLTDNAVKTIRKVVDLMPMITHEASNLLYDFLIDHPRIFPLISDPDV